eukprot:scaffold236613_cov33-Tisochrysis_lutea.AAC.2
MDGALFVGSGCIHGQLSRRATSLGNKLPEGPAAAACRSSCYVRRVWHHWLSPGERLCEIGREGVECAHAFMGRWRAIGRPGGGNGPWGAKAREGREGRTHLPAGASSRTRRTRGRVGLRANYWRIGGWPRMVAALARWRCGGAHLPASDCPCP